MTGCLSGSPRRNRPSGVQLILFLLLAVFTLSMRANLAQQLSQSYASSVAHWPIGPSGEPENNVSEAAGRPLTACGILAKPGSYVLQRDVSSPQTCFSIQADHVNLNLNGHTITYGTTRGSVPAYGVLGVACWDADFGTGNPCGGTFRNLTVYGGSITQGPGAAAFSDAIRLGQGPGNGLTVHDVTFYVHADSSIPIYSTFLGTRAKIYNTTIKNEVTVVQNRHQEQGQSVKFADSSHIPGPAAIYGNHITGGAQGGIFSQVKGTKIHDNFVSQKATYTNDFGIYAWSDDGEVFNNTVTPILGRGISIAGASKGEQVHNNKIIVIEQKDNAEYQGCQIGGTFGIQFDEAPTQASSFGNTVFARADQCDAQALRVTDSRAGSGNMSHDNRYTAERIGQSAALATGFGTGGAKEFASERDTFIGDSSAVAFDWDGGQNLIFRECVFGKGTNPATNFVTFSFRNGGTIPVKNVHFVDSLFQNGAAKDNTNMNRILANGDWPGPAEYFMDWTLWLTVRDQNGKPVPGATVEIKDALETEVHRGTTDTNGDTSAVLTEFRMFNDAATVHKERHTPHVISVHKEGCHSSSAEFPISVTQTSKKIVELDCSSESLR